MKSFIEKEAQEKAEEILAKVGITDNMEFPHLYCVYYAPINIMPNYPPPGLYRGKGGAFDLF